MKFYFKVFLLSLVVTSLLFGSGLYAYLNHMKRQVSIVEVPNITDQSPQGKEKPIDVNLADLTMLEDLVEYSNRINVVILGTDGGRADTIMVASYDPDYQLLDIITVPRDTYNEVPGYDKPGQHKINSVFGYGKVDGGSNGMKTQVSKLLGIPIHHFVTLDYNGVADIVDTIGGVEIDVHKDLVYDDPTAEPPLHINIQKGKQVLKGEKAVEYLRWRKNNGEEGSDLDRTQRQVGFVKAVITKSLSQFKLIKVIETAFNYVYTDMPLQDMLYYSTTVVGFNPSTDIYASMLPGEVMFNKLSYYIHDAEDTEELLIAVYRRGVDSE
ncbi:MULTISPECIES: LCP family protein [unclassified Fusibacter]|uniref:LCP family protein n=1 Tax=unclassified Fusibacter TaxID=2624464 RepID=UPI0010109FCA|nr:MULTISPECIES: LCP family protein [unclassified Fusibacter]MCK8059472.1 LCP family protein [Fusibacter sp. A2]NPE21064.1 hypothetical protein [Fusibacter sp. A1]RXV62338.1 hypothetical protein DWB64_04460 [Fusibacter sp. A1]